MLDLKRQIALCITHLRERPHLDEEHLHQATILEVIQLLRQAIIQGIVMRPHLVIPLDLLMIMHFKHWLNPQ